MAVYNMTGIAGNSTLEFVQGINTTLMGGWLGALFLIGITVMMFISFTVSTNDFKRSIAPAMFIAFVLSLSMVALDLLNPLAIFITLIGAAIGIAFSWGG